MRQTYRQVFENYYMRKKVVASIPFYGRTRTFSRGRFQSPPTVVVSPSQESLSPALFHDPAFKQELLPHAHTFAGRADTLFHWSSLRPRQPAPIPIWRRGYKNGRAHRALFNKPTGLAVDVYGNIFVADSLNHCIRRISSGGRVSTWSHKQNGLSNPTGLCVDAEQRLFVVDQGNQQLKIILKDRQTIAIPVQAPLLGGISQYQDYIYLTVAVQNATALMRVHVQSQRNELLTHWEGCFQWVAYRDGDQERPFSRWWQGRQDYPEPHFIARNQAEGLGLCHQGETLIWLNGLRIQRLNTRTAEHVETAFQLPVWPAPRWQGVQVAENGGLYAIDAQHHQVYLISEAGTVSLGAETTHGLETPYALARNAYGQVFISDTGHWRICRLNLPNNASLLQLARRAYLPYLPAPMPLKKGVHSFMKRYLPSPSKPAGPSAPVIAQTYALDVLKKGKQTQQLACVKELTDILNQPVSAESFAQTRPVLAAMLSHENVAVRTLLIQKMGETIHNEGHALLWLELFEAHPEHNRLLKKYRLEMLQFLGKRYQLYGHVTPLMVRYISAEEEDVVEFAFAHLTKIREAGYASLVDPLVEALR